MPNLDPQLTKEVIGILAEERCLRPEKLNLTDRLLDDLGMDGDDAVEFFAAFEAKFQIDLSQQYDHWDHHFGPEGFGLAWVGLIPLTLFGWAGLIKLGVHPYWAVSNIPLGVVLITYLIIRDRRRAARCPYIAVTVTDLIDAVSAGRWVVKYS
ncbi:MAG: DUF1493 family protein [Caulobacter sp.]|nr:DUF1493 family protein [Caulobacter sp.]